MRNSLRPVNRLPREVLASCATFVSDSDPRPIVSLTHVCRYWRRSICSSPRNWASIATVWKQLVPLCLERAGAVPLAVDIIVPEVKGDIGFLSALLPHVERVAHLSFTGHSSIDAVANDLPGFFASPMPNLTSLALRQAQEPAELFPADGSPMPPIFQSVSKLKSLRLTQTPIYPPLFNIPFLVELKMIGYTSPFNFGTFVGFLASNNDLEIVVLDIKFIEGSVWTVPARMVPLARLRHLSITCANPIDAKGLLSCISLRSGIRLEVFCSHWSSLDSYLPSPPAPVQKVLAPITVVKFQNSPREFHVFGKNGSFSFRCSRIAFWIPELHLFPTASVREFHVNNTPWTLTPVFLVSTLCRLPALETLVITDTASWATGTFESLAGQPLSCPSLKTIAFFNCVLTPEVTTEFESVVARRKGLEAAWLYRVVIVSSTGVLPSHTVIQRLRQHVPYVDVRVDDKLPDLP